MAVFPGTPGDDLTYGTEDPDVITGLAGNDRQFGFGGDDTLDGGDNNDTLDGGTGADTMTGGAGNDFYVVDDAGDVVTELAGGGSDLVFTYITYTLPAEVERLAVYSRSSTDAVNLTGNALANELIGNNGANYLDGGDGADIMQGGDGDDQYLVSQQGTVTVSARPSNSFLPGLGYMYLNSNAPDMINETAGPGTDTIWVPFTGSVASHDYFDYTLIKGSTLQNSSIEVLAVYDAASTYAVNLQGDIGNNEVRGNDGRNMLDGWSGVDRLVGYDGDDIYFVDNSGDLVVEAANEGYDTVYLSRGLGSVDPGLISYTLSDHVERLIASGGGTTLTGNALDNEIVGNGRDNVIDGMAGADKMSGGNGSDTYYVDNANDQVIDTSGANVIFTSVTYTLPDTGVVRMTALGSSDINLTGNTGATELIGNAGANVIDGRAGADAMAGHGGNDVYFVDNIGDTVTEDAGEGDDLVYVAQVDFTLSANVERGGALDRASTTAFNLTGNAGDNELWGDDGANVLDGKEGIDVLTGGGGADQFVFSTPFTGYSSIDQLVDFVSGTDKIVLDDAIYQAFTPGTVSADAFIIGTEAQDADDFLMYDPSTGYLYYDGDATGSYRESVHIATLHEGTLLAVTDFAIV